MRGSRPAKEVLVMKALEGIRVADLGHVLAAPTASMILADLGGEAVRRAGPYSFVCGKVLKNHAVIYTEVRPRRYS